MSDVGVFIVESTNMKDEAEGRCEGKLLMEMLKLLGIKTEYWYIRTRTEFEKMMVRFADSDYRYLHVSCHGDEEGFATTFEQFTFDEFDSWIPKSLPNRRLFLSACSTANDDFSKALTPTNFLSIIGPSEAVAWDDAAIFWAAFYHRMFNINRTGMKNSDIEQALHQFVTVFRVNLTAYFMTERKYVRKRFGDWADS